MTKTTKPVPTPIIRIERMTYLLEGPERRGSQLGGQNHETSVITGLGGLGGFVDEMLPDDPAKKRSGETHPRRLRNAVGSQDIPPPTPIRGQFPETLTLMLSTIRK